MARPSSLDQRKIRVTIYTPDRGNFYYEDPLDIYVNGEININQIQSHCSIRLSNLSESERDYILTKTSPYNYFDPERKQVQVSVEVGRVSTGYRTLYEGFIFSSTVTPPPDVSVTLECQFTFFGAAEFTSLYYADKTTIKQVAQGIVDRFNESREAQDKVSLNFLSTAESKTINNVSWQGPKPAILDVLRQYGLDATLVGNTLYVRDKGKAYSETVTDINVNTGMIGIPQITENGIIVKFLLDTPVQLGNAVRITSKLYKAANGIYRIFNLAFEAATRDEPFYYIATCSRDFSTYGVNS